MMKYLAAEQPINTKATLWTVGVHLLLLLLFILVRYSVPAVEEVPEMGMEVNLGTSDNASGTSQPMAVENPSPDAASVSYFTNRSESNNTKDVFTTDKEDAPSVNPAVKNIRTGNSETKKTNKHPDNKQALNSNNTRPQRPKYVYQGGAGSGGNTAAADVSGGDEGNTAGKGDRGVPAGAAGAANYSGVPGSGNGISHSLSGRSIIAFPSPEADFREGGKVVVRVTVNKAGSIVNRQIISASNAQLRVIALQKVEKIKFNKSDDAPEEQFGNITFVFKTRS